VNVACINHTGYMVCNFSCRTETSRTFQGQASHIRTDERTHGSA